MTDDPAAVTICPFFDYQRRLLSASNVLNDSCLQSSELWAMLEFKTRIDRRSSVALFAPAAQRISIDFCY